jgi:hypothetical protein
MSCVSPNSRQEASSERFDNLEPIVHWVSDPVSAARADQMYR